MVHVSALFFIQPVSTRESDQDTEQDESAHYRDSRVRVGYVGETKSLLPSQGYLERYPWSMYLQVATVNT